MKKWRCLEWYAIKKMLFEVGPCYIDYCNMGSTVLHYNYIYSYEKKILSLDVSSQPPNEFKKYVESKS